jgi:DNA-binding response OmpR family regulator
VTTRVLLVEDERDTRELLGRALERADYECLLAEDLADALAILDGHSPVHVVVTDIVLGLDDRRGLQLLAAVRRRGTRTPVIVITAFADVEKVKFALNAGADHLLEKPFRAHELISVIQNVLSSQGGKVDAEGLFARAHLTDKERTVARHLLSGLSSNEIAALEHNSPKTIRQHITQIYAKCEVSSRAEFFRLVYEP